MFSHCAVVVESGAGVVALADADAVVVEGLAEVGAAVQFITTVPFTMIVSFIGT